MTIPAIGTLSATAVLAAIGNGRQFRMARNPAARLELVTRQQWTRGKQALLGMRKRGNRM
ncbi:transposase [Bradyrhizobium retamae]|uniref:transposase n=1 Tax=Bradyrhizobium retamae TaxID=1300035 RepID=UPI0009E7160C|nr:transposase [Bradyrhizobium retamae]